MYADTNYVALFGLLARVMAIIRPFNSLRLHSIPKNIGNNYRGQPIPPFFRKGHPPPRSTITELAK